jgi:hypothetical protein
MNTKHKTLLFIGLILSNIICYYLFSKIYFTFENFRYNNTIIMNLSIIFIIFLLSFFLIIFEILSVLSLYLILNNFTILYIKKYYEKYAKYN